MQPELGIGLSRAEAAAPKPRPCSGGCACRCETCRRQEAAGRSEAWGEDKTYSVCSLGRHWNADLPTNWIGLS